jgi:hypothetical protein
MRSLHKMLPILIVAVLSLANACGGGGFDGTYLPVSGGGITLDFSGGKVKVNMLGDVKVLDYKVEADKVTILNPQEGNLVLVRNSDGSLTSPIGTFSKSKK